VFPGAEWLFSLFGAALVLSFVLYPYVFLLVRAALLRDAGRLLEAAQCLGAGAGQVLRRVVLPLVRSGLLAGMLLVMMEVAAEYGAVSYLGVPTLAVGIFRAWYGYQSLALAAVLALILVVVAFGLRGLEQRLYGAQQAAPGGGLRDVTLSLGGRTELGQGWALFYGTGVSRLVDVSAASPLVRERKGWGLSAGVVKRLGGGSARRCLGRRHPPGPCGRWRCWPACCRWWPPSWPPPCRCNRGWCRLATRSGMAALRSAGPPATTCRTTCSVP
jgi:ABC-type Fe3+ transport system permease subunit